MTTGTRAVIYCRVSDPGADDSLVIDSSSILRDDQDKALDDAEAELYALSQRADESAMFMMGESDER